MRRTVSMLVAATFVTTGFAAFLPTAAATTVPLTLYMRSDPTTLGPIDWLFVNGNVLSPDAPTKSEPSLWHAFWPLDSNSLAETPVDAHWTWAPTGGYDLDGVYARVVFWAVSPGGALGENSWQVKLYSGNTMVAYNGDAAVVVPVEGTAPALYEVVLGPLDLAGARLTVKIDPWWGDQDGANAILYDSVEYPSRLELLASAPTPPSKVTAAPLDLYLHGTTPVGQANLFVDPQTMDARAPMGHVPKTWTSAVSPVNGVSPNSLYDANWAWRPAFGFDLDNVTADVHFWVLSPGGAAFATGFWRVELYVDDVRVAGVASTELAAKPGIPSEFVVSFGPLDLEGQELTLLIDAVDPFLDAAHVLLYDTVEFPSRVELRPANDLVPPPQVTGLTVSNATAVSLALAWTAATDDVRMGHYKVYRTDADPDNPYDDATYTYVTFTAGTALVDGGLAPLTTYGYKVSAVDAAGNEGPLSAAASGTTLAPDVVAPTLSVDGTEAGATVFTIAASTDEPTTFALEYGPTLAYGSSVAGDGLNTTHGVAVTGLTPGATYHWRATASDPSGNPDTATGTFTTTTTGRFFLHARLEADNTITTWMNELNATADRDGSGFNALGAVAGAAEAAAGATFPLVGPIEQSFPALDPTNPGLAVDTSRGVTAAVHVRTSASAPTAGTVARDTGGRVELTLTVRSAAGVLGSQTVVREFTPGEAWARLDFAFPAAASAIAAGTLVATIDPGVTTTAYTIGYEGDHASSVSVPVEPTLPLATSAAYAGTAVPLEDAVLAFDGAASGGVPPYAYAWDFAGEGSSSAEDPGFAFPTAGAKEVTLTVTDAASNVATSTLLVRVRQLDFVGAPRVVVAVVDSGINPYHETYRRPGIELPLDELRNASDDAMPRAIQLTFGPDHAANVAADAADWASIGERELVWFEGTNVLGISIGAISANEKRVLDDPAPSALGDQGGHGTATSDTVLDAWPDAIVVMVENSNAAFSPDIPDAFTWAVSQPWVDVISGSLGVHANAPEPVFLYEVPAIQRAAWASGKLWVESAGNDPSLLPTDGLDGAPWVVSVTGSQEDGQAKEISSSYRYVDVASDFTVVAAKYDSVDADASISGTSFSCPTVAGTLAGAVHELRRAAGWNGGIEDSELVPPTDVTNADVRDAMNKSALYPAFEGYVAGFNSGGDHMLTPVAPWTQFGWGHVDGALVGDLVAVVESGDYTLPAPPAQKGLAKLYMDAVHAERAAYWSAWLGEDVHWPGATVPSGPLGPVFALTPMETAHPYAPSAELAWSVSVPGAAALQIHFEEFETEAGYDFVYLEDPAGNVLAVYHGPGVAVGAGVEEASAGRLDFWTVPVPGDTVVIRFTSDEFVEFHGFRVDEIASLG